MNKEAVTLMGKLRLEMLAFNDVSGQIVVRGDVYYRDRFYRNAPLVTLTISEDERVNDTYFFFLPYLKPVVSFRVLLLQTLGEALNTEGLRAVLGRGIREYIAEIRSFSEPKSLVNQAKNAANSLDARGLYAVSMARAVLKALGKTPTTDMPFEVWSPS